MGNKEVISRCKEKFMERTRGGGDKPPDIYNPSRTRKEGYTTTAKKKKKKKKKKRKKTCEGV